MSHNSFRGSALARLAALCLGTSALTGGAVAQVIDYPNGSNSGSPIVLTNNTTQLQVLTGSATQTGDISESGGSFGFEKIGSGTLILNGNNTYTGTTTITSGSLQLGTSIAQVTILGPIVDNGQLIFSSCCGTATLSGNITGGGSLVVSNLSSLILTGSNSYGNTIISGALSVGGGGTTGSLGAGSVTDNGSLTFNRSDSVTISTPISGSGSLDVRGGGMFTINAPQAYTGGTGVESGTTLILSGNGSLASGVGVGAGGTFDVSHAATVGLTVAYLSGFTPSPGALVLLGNNTLTISNNTGSEVIYGGNITGTGGITISAGQQRFTGVTGYTGVTTIATGATLRLTNGGSIAASSGVIDNGTFDPQGGTVKSLTGTGSVTSSLTITNASGTFSGIIGADFFPPTLTIAGGVQTLSGNNLLNAAITNSGAALVLSGSGSLGAGSTVTNNGTLDISAAASGISIQFLTGAGNVILGSNALTLTNLSGTGFASNFSGVISGTGGVTIVGGTGGSGGNRILSGNNTYSGATTIQSGGTLQIGNGGTSGSIVSNVADSGTLVFDRSDSSTYAGAISGTGSVKQIGAGTLILTGADTYTGGTTVSGGALQIGNGGTAGTIVGNVSDNAALIFNHSDNIIFSGSITGIGTVSQAGAGTLTLSGTNFIGATTVSAGTLNVTGSIISSNVNVSGGAVLTGTGTIGSTDPGNSAAVAVGSGGTLAPGSGTAPGTLTVAGTLNLAPGASYVDAVTPQAVGRTNVIAGTILTLGRVVTSVGGSASINGNVIANFAPGTYASGRQYTIITAAGGVSGTFSSFGTTGLPGSLRASLSYDANDVYLNLKPNALAPSLAGNTTTNQHSVVAAIDASVMAGAVPSGGFNALYNLSGPALNSAIDQISGQIGPNVSNAVGQSFLSFLAMTAEGGAGDMGSYAPASAYGAADAPHRAQLDGGETRAWGAAYGGHVGLLGDAATGAAALSASNVGLIGGADMQLADHLLAGVTFGWGRQHFNSGNGSGSSTDYALGLYGRADLDAAYVTAAFGYGWHQIATLRVVTVSGTDVLQGGQNADDYGSRIEAGWRMALDEAYTIAPYAAFAGESFESPAYAETALSGSPSFALSYAGHASTLGRSELGAHLDRSYELGNGGLTADIKAAWAHQLDDQPFTQASFVTLPTAGFQVLGARSSRDAALLGADLELHYASGLFLGLKGEGQFGAGTTIVEGLGSIGLRW